ncbi:MAG TPA: hypothetical protein VK085_04245 [Pseudogracilibacillus sp.]|nr:hypothetical protein [Pseudogracilibacillus sp.]
MKKEIYCEECSGKIHSKEDLITAQFKLDIIPLHEECYAHGLKGVKSLYLKNKPVNGFSGNASAFMFAVLGLSFLIFGEGDLKYVAIFTLIPLSIRLFSYLKFERHLD